MARSITPAMAGRRCRPTSKAPRLRAALLALALLALALASGMIYARSLEQRYLRALAPLRFTQKNQGSALQQAAFEQPDMLPLYGSSELIVGQPYQRPYYAAVMFQKQPTGFGVLSIGTNNTTSLIILQKLAAIGPELRGKKVVISLSPGSFYNHSMVMQGAYAGNFSRLHAGALAFSTDLSFDLKHAAARRMLQYPRTLRHDPLLRFALERLADGSPLSRALYYAVLPLGKLQNLILRLQDHWEMAQFIWRHQGKYQPNLPRLHARADWPGTLSYAQRLFEQHNTNNPFGFDDTVWRQRLRRPFANARDTWSDKAFLARLKKGREWGDLNLLLRGLKELGAQPLILSVPLPGQFLDYIGVSPQARAAYYTRLQAAVAPYGFALDDFANHDRDRTFLFDVSDHLSALGWARYDQVIDAFYHGTLTKG